MLLLYTQRRTEGFSTAVFDRYLMVRFHRSAGDMDKGKSCAGFTWVRLSYPPVYYRGLFSQPILSFWGPLIPNFAFSGAANPVFCDFAPVYLYIIVYRYGFLIVVLYTHAHTTTVPNYWTVVLRNFLVGLSIQHHLPPSLVVLQLGPNRRCVAQHGGMLPISVVGAAPPQTPRHSTVRYM